MIRGFALGEMLPAAPGESKRSHDEKRKYIPGMDRAPPLLFPYPFAASYGHCLECGVEAELMGGFCTSGTNCGYDHSGRLKRGVSRAIDYGCTFVWFDPREIFDAFGWHCYIRGVETPRSLSGKQQSTAPQLDHIIPLSRGGPHTPENTACICARCNNFKGDRSLEELSISVRMLSPEVLAMIPRSTESPWPPMYPEFDENDPIVIEARLAAEESMAEAIRDGWRPPVKKVRRPRRSRLVE